ncbi:MAG: hypothetical protein FWC64_06090 [Treponema sp.]|nr:hypothetical protein [Treponema sp.]
MGYYGIFSIDKKCKILLLIFCFFLTQKTYLFAENSILPELHFRLSLNYFSLNNTNNFTDVLQSSKDVNIRFNNNLIGFNIPFSFICSNIEDNNLYVFSLGEIITHIGRRFEIRDFLIFDMLLLSTFPTNITIATNDNHGILNIADANIYRLGPGFMLRKIRDPITFEFNALALFDLNRGDRNTVLFNFGVESLFVVNENTAYLVSYSAAISEQSRSFSFLFGIVIVINRFSIAPNFALNTNNNMTFPGFGLMLEFN